MLDFTWTGAGAIFISGSISGVSEIGEGLAVAADSFSEDNGVAGFKAGNLLVGFGRAAELPAKEDDDAADGAGSADAGRAASRVALLACEFDMALPPATF
jgi:hypothetical protein